MENLTDSSDDEKMNLIDSSKEIDWSNDKKFRDAVDSIVDKLQLRQSESKAYPKTSIFKVPSKLSNKDINNNSPHFVSIGPLHRGQADLVAMEDVKYWYSMFFFKRSHNPAMMLKDCCEAIIELHDKVQGYYTHGLETFDMYDLMKLMVVDGSFLLELFLRYSGERKYGPFKNNEIDFFVYGSNDLILGNSWTRSAVCQDLALFENQIPFIVLETLMEKIQPHLEGGNGVNDYILNFFSSSLNFTSDATPICIDGMSIRIDTEEEEGDSKEEEGKPSHILEALHMGLRPSWKLENGNEKYGLNYGATNLIESGINIKKRKFDLSDETDKFNCNLLEMKFDKNKGTLEIPLLWIGGTTSLIMRNLVAFEQLNFRSSPSHHVTSYLMFMKSLIRSKQDIQLLKRRGIIKQHPGSNSTRNVTDFFDSCCEGFAVKNFYFSQVCEEVEDYSKRKWIHFHSYVTSLRGRSRMYVGVLTGRICPDPCRTIAFFAATVLLIVTCLQTYYTVYPKK